MAFMLYSVKNDNYSFACELRGATGLWGENGIVAKCARPQINGEGSWSITEEEMLASIRQEGNAILDDLVPR